MALQAVASTGNHADKLRLAVHSLKFDACPSLAQPLGERLSRRLATLAWLIDIILPVPLHTQREHDRGYNQSELLCAEVSRQSGLPMLSDALIRQIATRPQVGLDAAARHANMRNAFSADPRQVSAKTILLIDDVRTTGATLDACAQALHTAGAAGVYGLTVTSA